MANEKINWENSPSTATPLNAANLNKMDNAAVKGADFADSATTVGKAVLTATDAAAARTAIGAGTSNLKVGTGAADAKAGNYAPTWSDVSGKPAVIASGADQAAARASIGAGTSSLIIGTTSTTAKAGDAVQTATQTTATAVGGGTATNVQGILGELAARIAALETP